MMEYETKCQGARSIFVALGAKKLPKIKSRESFLPKSREPKPNDEILRPPWGQKS